MKTFLSVIIGILTGACLFISATCLLAAMILPLFSVSVDAQLSLGAISLIGFAVGAALAAVVQLIDRH